MVYICEVYWQWASVSVGTPGIIDGTCKDVIEEIPVKGLFAEAWAGVKRD